jgi:hypothetical protein
MVASSWLIYFWLENIYWLVDGQTEAVQESILRAPQGEHTAQAAAEEA